MPKPFPKLNISSHRKRCEGHENVTLQAERFRRHVSHAKEFQAEYSNYAVTAGTAPPALPCQSRAQADSRAMCSGG